LTLIYIKILYKPISKIIHPYNEYGIKRLSPKNVRLSEMEYWIKVYSRIVPSRVSIKEIGFQGDVPEV